MAQALPAEASAKAGLRAQDAEFRKSVRVSVCHKKKQEVDFDLFCRLVPRKDKSCNKLWDTLQKPEALTTFGRSDVQKYNLHDNRYIQPA